MNQKKKSVGGNFFCLIVVYMIKYKVVGRGKKENNKEKRKMVE